MSRRDWLPQRRWPEWRPNISSERDWFLKQRRPERSPWLEADVARVDSEVEATRDDAECFDQDRLGAEVEMLMIDAERL